MARTRSLKPGFFKNEDLAKLPFQWRILYEGLWTQADRVGRLEERPLRLKAELFPYDDLDVEEGLAHLADAKCADGRPFIIRYEVNGSRYIAIPTFGKHQSPHVDEKDAGIPPPPRKHRADPISTPDEPDAGTGQARPVPGTSTGTSTSTGTALRARFDLFWRAYPEHKRVGEDAAWTIWKSRKPDVQLTAQILAALERQKRSAQWTKADGQFVPKPKTYLKEAQWKDAAVAAHGNGASAKPRPRGTSQAALDQAQKTRQVKELIHGGMSRAAAIKQVYG